MLYLVCFPEVEPALSFYRREGSHDWRRTIIDYRFAIGSSTLVTLTKEGSRFSSATNHLYKPKVRLISVTFFFVRSGQYHLTEIFFWSDSEVHIFSITFMFIMLAQRSIGIWLIQKSGEKQTFIGRFLSEFCISQLLFDTFLSFSAGKQKLFDTFLSVSHRFLSVSHRFLSVFNRKQKLSTTFLSESHRFLSLSDRKQKFSAELQSLFHEFRQEFSLFQSKLFI